MSKIVEEIEAKKAMYGEIGRKIAEVCGLVKETVYTTKQLVKALGLDVTYGINHRGLSSSIRNRYGEYGLLKFRVARNPGYSTHYGVSEPCGSRECVSWWCPTDRCPTGKGNEQLRIVDWDEKFKL